MAPASRPLRLLRNHRESLATGAIQSVNPVTTDPTTATSTAASTRAAWLAGIHLTTVSRAATCQGSKTGTWLITRSARPIRGERRGSSASVATTSRASSRRARQAGQPRTCSRSGATPKPRVRPTADRFRSVVNVYGAQCLRAHYGQASGGFQGELGTSHAGCSDLVRQCTDPM